MCMRAVSRGAASGSRALPSRAAPPRGRAGAAPDSVSSALDSSRSVVLVRSSRNIWRAGDARAGLRRVRLPRFMGTLKRSQRITLAIGLLATVAAGVSRYAGAPAVVAFLLAAIALAALASIVSFATEQVGERFGPAVTGFLQSTLGNLPEFFIVVFALSAGQVVVAQTSIIGSLFANALLVLGLVIVTGAAASKDGIMRFRIRLPNDTATLLLVASFIIVVVGIAVQDRAKAASHVQALSAIAAVALLAVYATWVWGYLRSDTPSPEPDRKGKDGETQDRGVPLGVSVALLAVAGAG